MKSTSAAKVSGVFPPIPTPFHENGDLNLGGLKRNMEHWNQMPLDGYVVMGSNGECVHLDTKEKVALAQATRAFASPDRLVIVGSGMQSTRATVDLTCRLAEAGGDIALVITPNYYRNQMTEQAVANHFSTVADASPIPILLYNVPAYSGIDMPNDLILRLAQHPNILGIKESSGHMGKAADIIQRAPPHFYFLTGTANSFLDALTLGAAGGIMALANIAPAQLNELKRAFLADDMETARSLQRRLGPANIAITAKMGVPGLKAAMDILGTYGGPPRLPLLPLDTSEREVFRAILTTAGIQWTPAVASPQIG